MNLIDREALKTRLDRGDDFKLVMTLGNLDFRTAHIPGSINITSMEQAQTLVSPDDEIVVYCHDEHCPASKSAYQLLVDQGFTNVWRYPGGIRDWQDAGYPVEKDADLGPEKVETHFLKQPITAQDHIQGVPDAPISLVVYGDYECPYTRRLMTNIKGLQRRLGDDLCFVYRHFPAPPEIHPHAWVAAEAALAANEQGNFWVMHHHLFSHQQALTYEHLGGYALDLGLNVSQFRHEMDKHVHQSRIEQDRQGGWKSGVREIPTLFINSERHEGELTMRAIAAAIEAHS